MKNNYAYIDGQNLFLGTTKAEKPWQIDLARFRVYLAQKYGVSRAYYFLGFMEEAREELYSAIQEAGFILVFRKHNSAMLGKKKGNVDVDIVFHIMKKLYHREDFSNIVLVSGDGDYKLLVDFLIQEKRFEKILFPERGKASSLYKSITRLFFDDLSKPSIKEKVMRQKKGGLR